MNLLAGAQRNLENGRSAAAGFIYSKTDSDFGIFSRKFDGRLSYAHRPNDSKWIWLDRVNLINEVIEDATGGESHGRKLVNNLNANWKPNLRTQIALQYGAKYVLDKIDGEHYDGYIDLIGAEARRDLNKDWDVGLGKRTPLVGRWAVRLLARRFGRLHPTGKLVGIGRLQLPWIRRQGFLGHRVPLKRLLPQFPVQVRPRHARLAQGRRPVALQIRTESSARS